MDIIGIGIDIVYVPRIERLFTQYGEKFLKKIFLEEEIEYAFKRKNPFIHLSASFASKEAFFKALKGYSPFSFKEIILIRDPSTGAPSLQIKGKAKEIFEKRNGKKILLALSHENEYTISIVVILGD